MSLFGKRPSDPNETRFYDEYKNKYPELNNPGLKNLAWHRNEAEKTNDQLLIKHFDLLSDKYYGNPDMLLRFATRAAVLDRDTERITTIQIREVLTQVIEENNLPQIIADVFDGKDKLENYGIYDGFSPPLHFDLMTAKEQKRFHIDAFVPIFELSHDFSEILTYHKQSKGFARYYTETGINFSDIKITDWSHSFAPNMKMWYEDGVPESEIRKRAQLLGINNVDDILKILRF